MCAWEGEISLCVKVFTCEIADFLKALKKNVSKTELLTLTLAVNWLTRVDNVVYGNTRHKTDNVMTG